ncbi:MalY/PatB family protein [uncultured Bifidobacterium sp.]|uniref:MalY/PatB family protein n=1 Tax=uncultured Bifidobacterium sp. TaxID=165187 RepID=UPI003458346B
MYDFTTVVDRHGTGSEKWHLIDENMGEGNGDVLALSVADMEFRPAPQIVDALVESARNDIFGYDYVTDAYRDAVVSWMSRRHGFEVDPAWISVSDGVMPAVNVALRAFTHPGDRVIIQRPVYYPFTMAAEHTGLTILDNELILGDDGRYVMDFDDLERKASDPRCTAIIVCNPHNPVGRVWTSDELRRLGDIAIENGLTILCDEIHADFAYPGYHVTMFSTLGEKYARHCLEFTAPTKTFNLAGLLCSNVIIPDPERKRAFDIAAKNIGGLTVSHFGLVACRAAYTSAGAWLDELQGVLSSNLSIVREMADSCDGLRLIEPEGTYLAWLDCRELGLDSDALRDIMRGTGRVYLDEGSLFGRSGCGFERLNLACPTAMMERAVSGIADAARSVSAGR